MKPSIWLSLFGCNSRFTSHTLASGHSVFGSPVGFSGLATLPFQAGPAANANRTAKRNDCDDSMKEAKI